MGPCISQKCASANYHMLTTVSETCRVVFVNECVCTKSCNNVCNVVIAGPRGAIKSTPPNMGKLRSRQKKSMFAHRARSPCSRGLPGFRNRRANETYGKTILALTVKSIDSLLVARANCGVSHAQDMLGCRRRMSQLRLLSSQCRKMCL